MMRIAVVEDEAHFREILKEYLIRYEKEKGADIEVLFFQDGEDITEDYSADYDLVLLDIQMRFMNGMEAALRIRERDARVEIIFITGIADFAIEGYQVHALDYVMKPLSYETFSLKMDRAILHLKEERTQYLFVKNAEGSRQIDIRDILFIESEVHRLHIMTKGGMCDGSGTIGELEQQLQEYGFFRCNKGFLVNLNEVDGITENVCFIGSHRIPVSRRKRAELVRLMTDMI